MEKRGGRHQWEGRGREEGPSHLGAGGADCPSLLSHAAVAQMQEAALCAGGSCPLFLWHFPMPRRAKGKGHRGSGHPGWGSASSLPQGTGGLANTPHPVCSKEPLCRSLCVGMVGNRHHGCQLSVICPSETSVNVCQSCLSACPSAFVRDVCQPYLSAPSLGVGEQA